MWKTKIKYCPHHFTCVFERFKSRGITPALYPGSQISTATPQAKQIISQEIQENPTSFSNATIRKILRKELKAKAFKFHRCRENHKQQRLVFVIGFVIWTAHSPDLCPLDYMFWDAMDRIIHLQKANSIPASKRLINEAAREISEKSSKLPSKTSEHSGKIHCWPQ